VLLRTNGHRYHLEKAFKAEKRLENDERAVKYLMFRQLVWFKVPVVERLYKLGTTFQRNIDRRPSDRV